MRYILGKQDATIIEAEGVRMQNATAITQDFNMQRQMRPGLGRAVGHLVLSWSREDLSKLNEEVMTERAREYMEKMNIRNTQYVVVRHHDREHPHIHIVYNRVDNNGKTITDKNNFERNIKACKEITLKYGYHLGQGKQQVNRLALRGKEKIRYELYDAIKSAVKHSYSWKTLETHLQKQGIGIQYKYKSGTSEVQGVSFEKGELKMKGSAIDRAFSYGGLNAQLNRNHEIQQQHIIQAVGRPSLAEELREAIREAEHHHSHGGGKDILDSLLSPGFGGAEPDPVGDAEKRRRKRKQHEQEQSQGLIR